MSDGAGRLMTGRPEGRGLGASAAAVVLAAIVAPGSALAQLEAGATTATVSADAPTAANGGTAAPGRPCIPAELAEALRGCIAATEGERQGEGEGLGGAAGGEPDAVWCEARVEAASDAAGESAPVGPSIRGWAGLSERWRALSEMRTAYLIEMEIDAREMLLRKLPERDPREPEARFRLGQLYLELAEGRRYRVGELEMELERLDAERDPERWRETVAGIGEARSGVEDASDAAIAELRIVVEQFPEWELAAEAAFFLAMALDDRGRDAGEPGEREEWAGRAFEVRSRLVRDYPDSEWAAMAQAEMADYLRARGAPPVEVLASYESALQTPDSAAYVYALYMRAWTLDDLGRFHEAIIAFLETEAWAAHRPENGVWAELGTLARIDLLRVLEDLPRAAEGRAGVGDVEGAAEGYECFGEVPTADGRRVVEALAEAVELRLMNEQTEAAERDVELAGKRAGDDEVAQRRAAEAAFALAEEPVARGDWTAVVERMEGYVETEAERGGRDLAVRARVRLAQAHGELANCAGVATVREMRRCREHRDQAFEYAQDAAEMVPTRTAPGGVEGGGFFPHDAVGPDLAGTVQCGLEGATEEERPMVLAERMQALGGALAQAYFYLGERNLEQFLAMEPPEFDPGDWSPDPGECEPFRENREYMAVCMDTQRYKEWTEKALNPFVLERVGRFDAARRSWEVIAYFDAPEWEIAAARRIGDMNLVLWRDVVDAPVPPAFLQPEFAAVGLAYRRQIAEEAEPFRRRVMEAYEYCVAAATWAEEWTGDASACEAALEELDPQGHPGLREVFALPMAAPVHFAVPDIDLGPAVGQPGEERPSPAVPVAGAPTLDAAGRYRFHAGGDGPE
ncbi:MAG: hypothetical protein HY905_13320 [Deltaproteobacteria bacterium]|nr:hypothetical protein [Deltaproteobacteria bacterium]